MAGLFTTQPVSILPSNQSSAGATKQMVAQLQAQVRGVSDPVTSSAFGQTGEAITSLQTQIDTVTKALRQQLPFPDTISVTDPNGNPIAWFGYQVDGNVTYEGIWAAYAYFGGTSPANANITITPAAITFNGAFLQLIGTGGQIVLNASSTPAEITLTNGFSESILTPLSLSIGNTSTTENVFINEATIIMYGGGGIPVIELNAGVSPGQLLMSSVQVVTGQQPGPGAPTFSTIGGALTWCQALYNALSQTGGGHGLIV